MDLSCEGRVLIVGDGDFSFTVSLLKKQSLKPSQVTTSSLETSDSILQHTLASENMKVLTEMGVHVILETDARELHSHTIISQFRFHRVIFNFPLADRHNIKKNRALLADFFSSCSQILSDMGQVMVTLCKGQGGTPADQPIRSWSDSWQVHAMATNAGFILSEVVTFEASEYPEYHSVGFRFQDKSFNTQGALTHIFVKADMAVVSDDVCARGHVQSNGCNYTCSRYLAEKINRNLLQENNNPLCLLRKRLEASLNLELGAQVIHDKLDWCILPGHRSSVSIDAEISEVSDVTNELNAGSIEINNSGDDIRSAKERKNEANQDIIKNTMAASLVHGVDRVTLETNCQQSDSKIHQCQDEKLSVTQFIPENPESVFILIKENIDCDAYSDMAEEDHFRDDHNIDNCKEDGRFVNTIVQSLSGSDRDEANNIGNFKGTDCSADAIVQSLSASDRGKRNLESCDVNQGSHFMQEMKHIAKCEANGRCQEEDAKIKSCVGRVFHYRTSLLESLSNIYLYVSESGTSRTSQYFNEELSSSEFYAFGKFVQPSPTELIGSCSEVCNVSSQDESNLNNIHADPRSESTPTIGHCFVTSGQCYHPGPIIPSTLISRHEMMYVKNIQSNICAHTAQESTLSPHINSFEHTFASTSNYKENVTLLVNDDRNTERQHLQSYLSALEHFVSCLKNCDFFTHASLSVQDTDNSVQVKISGFNKVCNVKLIYIESELPTEATVKQLHNNNSKAVAGIMFQVANGPNQMFVAVLQLDTIVCKMCTICDPRLLWSHSQRFTNQFHDSSFPQNFSAFSLYPMMFAHDLSYWQNNSEFDVDEMYNIIRYIAGDLVCRVSLIDQYTDSSTGQRSQCYRLHFTSHDLALPYLVSWKLQSLIRMELSHKLAVTLR